MTNEAQWQERWELLSSKIKKGSNRGVSALNGIVGDYLAEKGLPMAVQMAFYHDNQAVTLTPQGLQQSYTKFSHKICILVHGLGCNEDVWHLSNSSTTYATLLGDELDYMPINVRYNTGLHISHNGQMLADMIEQLLSVYPLDVEEIILINHSMGGLVARSACFYAQQQHATWVNKVRQLYFIGSPHLGADLEKIGNVVATALNAAPLPYTSLLGEILNTRSAGIKDLRYGYVRDEDWQGQDPDDLLNNNKETVPLLAGADHFVITGTIHKDSNHILSQLFGDALVRKHSATGQSHQEQHNLSFLAEHHKEFTRIRHIKLAHSLEVYKQIREWIKK